MNTAKTVSRFEVELRSTGPDQKKIEKLLEQVKGLQVSPSEIVTSCPCIIATNVSVTASKKLKLYLEQAGASVTIRRHNHTNPKKQVGSAASPAPSGDVNKPSAKTSQSGNNGAAAQSSETTITNERSTDLSQPLLQPSAPLRNKASGASPHTRHISSKTDITPTPSIALKRSTSELTRALQDKDWSVREKAVLEIGSTPSNGVIKHLIGALKDDVWRVRCAALDVLSHMGSASALKEMAKCVEDDVWHVRYHAIGALGRMKSDKAIKPLISALNDENWEVRLRTVQVLGELRSKRALNGMISCLQDEVWQIRKSAARALAQLQSEKSVKPLLQVLSDPNWQVRSMAVSALWQIGSEKAVNGLIEALKDRDWTVHWKAAYALGKIGTTEILPILFRLEQEKNSFLQEVARNLLRSFEIVTETRKQTIPRGEYRSEDPYSTVSYIAPGHFIMGQDDGSDDSRPAQKIFLDGFFIDTYEVTNYQYKLFNPAHEYPRDMDFYPVVNITWEEANEYAAWIGKRLPSEAEWEKAARGLEGRMFPWGNEFDPNRCNTAESGQRRLTPVNYYSSGQSIFGVYDMVGNVLEWTADLYKPYHWSQYDCPDFAENFIVLRGGSWIHPAQKATCASRSYAPAENKSNFIGFRCVKDIK